MTRDHSYVIGGNSNGEYFKAPRRIASELSDTTTECCNTYNMLKLTRQLFFTDPDPRRLHRLLRADALQPHPRLAEPELDARVPVLLRAAAARRHQDLQQRLQQLRLLPRHRHGEQHQVRRQHLLPRRRRTRCTSTCSSPSVLTWPGRGITVRQDTTYPSAASTPADRHRFRRRSTCGSASPPGTSGAQVAGQRGGAGPRRRRARTRCSTAPGRPATSWTSACRWRVRREPTPDSATTQAVLVGPIVLAGAYGTTNLSAMPTLNPATLAPTATPLQYTATASTGPVTLLPFYRMHGQRYTVYWTVSTRPAAAGVRRALPVRRDGRHHRGRRHRQRPHRHAGRRRELDHRAHRRRGEPRAARRVREPARRHPGRRDRVHGRRLGAARHARHVVPGLRLRHAAPAPTCSSRRARRLRHGPVRDHHVGGSGAEQRINAPAALPTGAWTHVAVTRPATSACSTSTAPRWPATPP